MPRLHPIELVRRTFDNVWNVVGISVGLAVSLLPIAIDHFWKHDDQLVLALTFLVSYLALIAYLMLHLRTLRITAADADGVRAQLNVVNTSLAKAESDLRDRIAANRAANDQFKQLGSARAIYDGAVLKTLLEFTQPSTNRDKEAAYRDFERALYAYLNCICDTAVVAIAKNHAGATLEDFQSNIKLIAGETERGQRYSHVARSSNTKDERRLADTHDNPNYIVELNAFFDLLHHRNTKRRVVIDDINKEIEEWNRRYGHRFVEPDAVASNFYRACLVVPIHGPLYTVPPSHLGSSRRLREYGAREVLLGLLAVDSLKYPFDEEYDLSIVEELAVAAYSAIRAFDCFGQLIV